MKKILIILFTLHTNIFAYEVLSGDAATACEVILCLAGGGGNISECKRPIRKFFSITAKKPWKTLKLRKNFLALCPTQSANSISDDAIMSDLKDALIHIPHECTAQRLNKIYEYKYIKNPAVECPEEHFLDEEFSHLVEGIRISDKLPKECIRFINNEYSQLKMPKYKCDGTFYPKKTYFQHYYPKLIYSQSESSYFAKPKPNQEYLKIANEQKGMHKCQYSWESSGNKGETHSLTLFLFYKKILINPINYQCWE